MPLRLDTRYVRRLDKLLPHNLCFFFFVSYDIIHKNFLFFTLKWRIYFIINIRFVSFFFSSVFLACIRKWLSSLLLWLCEGVCVCLCVNKFNESFLFFFLSFYLFFFFFFSFGTTTIIKLRDCWVCVEIIISKQ